MPPGLGARECVRALSRRPPGARGFEGPAIPGADSIFSGSCGGFSGRASPLEASARPFSHPFSLPGPDQALPGITGVTVVYVTFRARGGLRGLNDLATSRNLRPNPGVRVS